MTRTAIIGAGFAGLAAGVELAARGIKVIVLEARPRLGGRAYSFRDEESGATVDNGQHAMMGCYRQTLAFLERIGAGEKVTRQSNLHVPMMRHDNRCGAITAAALPSPLHAVAGIARYRLLSGGERTRALLGGLQMMAMRRRRDARLGLWTVYELLKAVGQSDNARACFWYPLAIATLNELPERAAAAPFVEVLARAFFGTRRDSQFVFARVGLSELYTEDAQRFIEARGGRVELRAAVAEVESHDDRIKSLLLRDGRRIAADFFISAVPPRVVQTMLPDLIGAEFPTSPIVSVHLWYDRPVLNTAFAGCLGTTTQFVFNRDALTPLIAEGETNGANGQYLSAVISAGHDVVEWDTTRIADTVVNDLRALLPAARDARVTRHVVVKEKQATISTTPEVDRRRPGPRTPFANLFLAGDWTQTGLPATIESAVVSGNRSAALVAGLLGRG